MDLHIKSDYRNSKKGNRRRKKIKIKGGKKMAKIKWDWNLFWKVVKFILTLGLSHINKREEKNKNNTNNIK